MIVRPFREEDTDACWALLATEGLLETEMRFQGGITGVLDEGGVRGMFTLELVDGFPHLRHFCVARASRRPALARRLIRSVRAVVRQAGQSQMLVHAKQDRIVRLIRYYFRTASYQRTTEGDSLYLVEV